MRLAPHPPQVGQRRRVAPLRVGTFQLSDSALDGDNSQMRSQRACIDEAFKPCASNASARVHFNGGLGDGSLNAGTPRGIKCEELESRPPNLGIAWTNRVDDAPPHRWSCGDDFSRCSRTAQNRSLRATSRENGFACHSPISVLHATTRVAAWHAEGAGAGHSHVANRVITNWDTPASQTDRQHNSRHSDVLPSRVLHLAAHRCHAAARGSDSGARRVIVTM